MKRVNNIYNNICEIENIIKIYKKIKSNVKNKRKIEIFENYYTSNIIYIKNILDSKKYKTSKYNIFIIKEPKYRVIMSQNLIDKIINHLCAQYLLIPYLEKSLIDTNVATRLNKGTNYGINKLNKSLNSLKNKNFYYLKFDISKYFYNIDHIILKEKLNEKIKDKDALNILYNIIDSTNLDYINEEINLLKSNLIKGKIDKKLIKKINNIPNYKKGKGLPIGNMTSQFLAIYYLNDLDHYIKEKLKIKYYIRYMDDGILLHENKEYLKECLKKIKKILNNYKLELNKKTYIGNIKNGINFLGYIFYINNKKIIIKINNKNKRKIQKNLKLIKNGKKLLKSFYSYKGYFKYCTNNIYYLYNNYKLKIDYVKRT